MKVWTIQPPEVLKSLKSNKSLIVDPTLSVWVNDSIREKSMGCGWTFDDAYSWMVSQMDLRGVKGRGTATYPWWGWVKYNKKLHKPDLRTIGLAKKGTFQYCIELDLPDNEVLVSDHDSWHNVLNNADFWYGDLDDAEDFYDAYDKHQESLSGMTPEERQLIKLKSWESIFTVDYGYLQCTFWNLRVENVVRYQLFKAR